MSKTLAFTIPITFGDAICIKSHLDAVKHQYDQMRLGFHKESVKINKQDNPEYYKFLDDLGNLLFSDPPYIYEPSSTCPFSEQFHILVENHLIPQKPSQRELLCVGTPLKIGEYVVLSTKIRYFTKTRFRKIYKQFFDAIKTISNKYKIVVLGERKVEMCGEYTWQTEDIYGIYQQIVNNIPADQMIDLTIPALGITSPVLSQLQQDCLIMNQAKAVITLGVGGNFCMALGADSKMIGLRMDNEPIADMIFGDDYSDSNVMITKNFEKFLATTVKLIL